MEERLLVLSGSSNTNNENSEITINNNVTSSGTQEETETRATRNTNSSTSAKGDVTAKAEPAEPVTTKENTLRKVGSEVLAEPDDSGPKTRRASTSILPLFKGNLRKPDPQKSLWKPSDADVAGVSLLLNVYKVHTVGECEDIDLFTQDILPRLTSIVATVVSVTKVKQQGNFVFMYTLQVCKKTVHGTIEIHLVSRTLKSFHDFHKVVKTHTHTYIYIHIHMLFTQHNTIQYTNSNLNILNTFIFFDS